MSKPLTDILHRSAAGILCLLLTACFTGIDSTPRIKAPEGMDSDPREMTAEATEILGDVSPEQPGQWQPGKLFHVLDAQRMASLINPGGKVEGDLSFTGFEAGVSIMGDSLTRVRLTDQAGQQLTWTVTEPLSQLGRREALRIPFTVEKSIVDRANSRLRGKRLYITTRLWRDTTDRIISQNRRFLPVEILRVAPGTEAYPLRLDFREETSGTRASIFVNPTDSRGSSRRVEAQLSLTDPRKRYPAISDPVWQNIVNGTVTRGMTGDECRLALGAPERIYRPNTESLLRQVWTYSNGITLTFEENILTDFRR